MTAWQVEDWRKTYVRKEDWRKILEKSEFSLDCCALGDEDDEFHL
jgi:hypothetical protein